MAPAAARVALALLVATSVVAGSTAALAVDGGSHGPTAQPDAIAPVDGAPAIDGAPAVEGASAAGDENDSARERISEPLRAEVRAAADREAGVGTAAASDRVEVVVQFEPASEALPAQARSAPGLQEHARVTQAPFERFVQRTPGVERRQDFWIANAMLVEVDPDRVSLEELLAVEHVTRLHRNFEVEVADGATATAPTAGGLGPSAPTAGGALGTLPSIVGDAFGSPTSTAGDALGARATTSDVTYGLDMINATYAWNELGTRGAGVDVAILDTGADPNHPDVDVDGWAEFDSDGNVVSEGSENAYDSQYHGTHVAGTVVGDAASGTHIGVAPDARHHHGLVLPGGGGSWAQIVAGMEWATEDVEADVLSMSLGSSIYHSGLIEPIRNARDAGTLVVAAAGNDGEGTSGSPGNVYDSVSVGAVDAANDVASFSSGETIDTEVAWGSDALDHWPAIYTVPQVAAPGADIYSAFPTRYNSDYEELDGTSMAAPHVAGAAALLFASDYQMDDEEVERRLTETAYHPDGVDAHDHRYGHGTIDLYRATQNGSIRGNVSDAETEAPIANATVTLLDEGKAIATQRTDANGSYAFPSVMFGDDYGIDVDLDGYEPSAKPNVSVAVDVTTTVDAGLVALPGSVAGTVRDGVTDDPVANATVTLTNASGHRFGEQVTDADGRYNFTDVPRDAGYELSASATNFDDANATVDVGPGEAVARNLTPRPHDGSMAGRVTDDVTGDPIANATVALKHDGERRNATATTADGTFAFDPVQRADNCSLALDHADYRAASVAVDVGPGENVSRNASLSPLPGTVVGVVTDRNGTPVDRATVTLDAVGDDAANRTSVEPSFTAADGSFVLSGVPAHVEYALNVSARGYDRNASVSVAVAANGSTAANGTLAQRDRYVGVDALDAPASVDEGDAFAVGATVANLGAERWNDTVRLAVDGREVANRTVALNATENATLALSHAIDDDGTYELAVATANETRTAEIEVASTGGGGGIPLPASEPAPDVSVVAASVDASSVEVGERVAVDVTLRNAGDADGTYAAALTADGATVASASVDVLAGETRTVTLSTTFDEPGSYDLSVGGERAGTVEVAALQTATANDTATVADANATDGASPNASDAGGDELPGFGLVAPIVALLAVGALARRRS